MVTCDHNMAGNESDASSNASTIVSRSVTFNELLNDNDMAEVDWKTALFEKPKLQ